MTDLQHPPEESSAAPDLLPFVPRLALTLPDDVDRGVAHGLEGSLVLVDLSGFTAMSERLAKHGRVGAEEVTEVVSTTFAELLSVAWSVGGGLLKFGGDALLLAFTGRDHLERAAHAAIGMRRALRSLGRIPTSAGDVRLRMSVGVHAGELVFALAGETHRELLVVGPGASAVVRAEAVARPGQIVLSGEAADRLPARLLGEVLAEGRALARDPGPRLLPADSAERPAADPRAFVPVALRRHLEAGGGASEHRQAAVAFIRFQGTDEVIECHGPATLAARLHTLISAAQRAAADVDVSLLATDIDLNGGKLVLGAGVPSAHDDDEDRLLHAVRTVMTADTGLGLRAGVHAGALFAGVVGPSFRRTYTVMGDVVNTAARVAAHAAPGEVLTTEEVLARCGQAWATRQVAPFAAKGKAKPIATWVVEAAGGRVDEHLDERPLLGRSAEREALIKAVEAALSGRSCGVAVVGPRGAGASRLVDASLTSVPVHRVLVARSAGVEAAVPFSTLRQVLRPLLGLDGAPRGEDAGPLLSAATAVDADLARWPAALGALAGVPLDPSAKEAALEPRARGALVRAIATTLLRAADPGTVIVLDKLDSADSATARLLDEVAPALSAAPLCLLATATQAPSWAGSQVTLGRLDQASMRELTRRAGGASIAPHLLRRIAERGDGNPLVALELVAATRRGLDPDALPPTLERLAAARIDDLPPRARDLLRELSVLGPAPSWREVTAVTGAGPAALASLGGLVIDAGDHIEFASSLVREAAYEGLPRRRRSEVHRQAADALVADPDRAAAGAARLAHHYREAGDRAAAWRWAHVAAEQAQRAAAWIAAAEALQMAVAQPPPDLPTEALGATWRDLARARWALGDVAGADRAARRATRYLPAEGEDAADALLLGAVAALEQGRLAAASRRGRATLAAVEGRSSRDAANLRVRVLIVQGRAAMLRGANRRALRELDRAAAVASEHGDEAGVAIADTNAAIVMRSLGDRDGLKRARRAAERLERVGDPWTTGVAWNNVAVVASTFGEAATEATALERAAHTFDRAGAALMAAVVTNNVGDLQRRQGRWNEAEANLVRARDAFTALGVPYAGLAASSLARVLAAAGRLDDAKLILTETVATPEARGWLALAEAEVAACRGQHARAATALDEFAASDLAADDRCSHARLTAVVTAVSGRHDDAVAAASHARDLAVELGVADEEARALHLLVRLEAADDAERARLYELQEQLGIVAFPAVDGLVPDSVSPRSASESPREQRMNR